MPFRPSWLGRPRTAAKIDCSPRNTRYAAPTILSVVKAGWDAWMSPAMPMLAAIVQTSCPKAIPAAVSTPPRGPPMIELRMVSAVSGPGVQITTAQTPR